MLLDAGGTQPATLFQTGHTEGIRAFQGMGDAAQAVAVAVGLDDCDDAPPARGLANAPEIAAQGIRVDQRPGRAHQAKSPSLYESGLKFSNRVYCPRKVSRIVPIGPFRCLATMISAEPLSGLSSL